MHKKTIIILFALRFLIISICFFLFVSCLRTKNSFQYHISGSINDTTGKALKLVYINYYSKKVITKTDSMGRFLINKPKELVVEFAKEDYQSIKTIIKDYSDLGIYKFNSFALEKSTDTIPVYKELIYKKALDKTVQVNFKGKVTDVHGKLLQDVLITLTDAKNTSVSFDGTFQFLRGDYFIDFEKKGYEKLSIKINEHFVDRPEDLQEIILLKKKKEGVYFVYSNKLLRLPKARLRRTAEERIGTSLWGGRYGYNLDSFFYPKNVKELKINKKNKERIRFVSYEEGYKYIFLATKPNDFLSYVDRKSVFTSFPKGIHREQELKNKYYERIDEKGRILDLILNLDAKEILNKYGFISSKSKEGYFFTY